MSGKMQYLLVEGELEAIKEHYQSGQTVEILDRTYMITGSYSPYMPEKYENRYKLELVVVPQEN